MNGHVLAYERVYVYTNEYTHTYINVCTRVCAFVCMMNVYVCVCVPQFVVL